jgi:hypothetical protein
MEENERPPKTNMKSPAAPCFCNPLPGSPSPSTNDKKGVPFSSIALSLSFETVLFFFAVVKSPQE